MHLIGIEDPFAVDGNIGTMRGPGAASDQDVLAANQLGTFIAFDFEGMGIDESRVAFESGYVSCGAAAP